MPSFARWHYCLHYHNNKHICPILISISSNFDDPAYLFFIGARNWLGSAFGASPTTNSW